MCHVRPRRPAALTLLLLSLFLLGSAISAAAGQPPPGRRANARKLLRIANGASSRLIQAGQGKLGGDARSRPFWEALLHMNAQIDRIEAGLRTRDLSFFQALRTGTSSLAELQVTWALAGVKDPAIDQNLRTLSAAYARLRNRYGPEWIRFQAGRPLGEDERLRFARMRAEQGHLADRIEPLRAQARRAGDQATADELTLLLVQVHGVATASSTLGDYLDASVATDSIRGAWHGARAAHHPEEEGWAEADQVVSNITTDENVGFVFTTDLQEVKDWSFVEEETEIPAEIAQADEGEGELLAPGQIVDLGAAIEEVAPDPSERLDPETSLDEPEVLILDEEPVAEAEKDLDTEAAPEEEAIEEEDLAAEAPPGEAALEACTAEAPECADDLLFPAESAPPPPVSPEPPPPAAPGSPPIG
jgi:hypothetical protein